MKIHDFTSRIEPQNHLPMMYFVLVLSLFLATCGQGSRQENKKDLVTEESESNNPEEQAISEEEDYITGIYEYIYPDNGTFIENHYIKIRKVNNRYVGIYYGTSDEFDEAREGYYPGFFVARMENLSIDRDFIKFKLSVSNEQILTKPVELRIESYEQAIENGNESWPNKMTFEPKNYVGEFLDPNTIYFKGEMDFSDKKFYRINTF